jgi:hypothetical protein
VFRRPDGSVFTRHPADVSDDVDVRASVQGDLAPRLDAGFVEERRENRSVGSCRRRTTSARPSSHPARARVGETIEVVRHRIV